MICGSYIVKVFNSTIDVTFRSRDYARWPNIVEALGLINLSTIVPLVFPWATSTVLSNNVVNASWGFISQHFR